VASSVSDSTKAQPRKPNTHTPNAHTHEVVCVREALVGHVGEGTQLKRAIAIFAREPSPNHVPALVLDLCRALQHNNSVNRPPCR
jgi:hypothetical protein